MPMLRAEVGDFSVGVASEDFPSIQPPLASQGDFRLSKHLKQGTPAQRRLYTFGGPVAHVALRPGAVPWAIGTRLPAEDGGYLYSGVMLNHYGLGIALFATTRLWAHWPPTDPFFVAFHSDLWARRADYELQQPGLLNQAVEICGSGDACYLLNVGPRAMLAEVSAYEADGHVYSGAFCRFSPYERAASRRSSGGVMLTVPLRSNHLTRVVARPITIRPHYGDAVAVLLCYQADAVELQIAGAGAPLRGNPSTGWELAHGASTAVQVTVKGGVYPVAPLSRHQVEIHYAYKPTSRQALQADHIGRLRFDVVVRRARVRITAID